MYTFSIYQITYIYLFFSFSIIGIIIILLILIANIVSPKFPNFEKLTAYECGFEAFNDTNQQYDIRYFLMALFYILFDLELLFLFPWISILTISGNLIFYIGLDFIFELLFCYMILWQISSFDWK